MQQKSFESLYPDTAHFEQIAQIVGFVKEGNSCQLIGLPGVGRSTLLNLLANNRAVRIKHFGEGQKKIHFVLTNFSEIRKRPLVDAMKFLFLNLTESLRERKMLDENKIVGDIFREHLKFHDELILFQGFKEAIDYLCLVRGLTVVFLFDRFEEYIPSVTSEFFTNLRTLRSRAKYKFSVVFSLYRPLEMFLEASVLSDYYEFVAGHIIYLPLEHEETTNFRVAYIEKITGKTISKETLKQIITLNGGVGRLTKLSVEAVLANGESHKDLSKFLLSQKIINTALLEMWSVLTQAEQADLLQKKFDDPEINSYLEQVGMIKNEKIQIPLFEKFIEDRFSHEQTEKSQIIYDENTNTIHKGEDILSDQLTASEFRMLAFLLRNIDRIVERDELVNVVWAENKSTAGITDQAVDQLIFRLRRKIEDDPNNPHHLLTVKGRGFRFIA
jgi:DNA-binding winged helix-turn-helix (wHTH) protein